MSSNLTHHFLIAMPKLGDPNFSQTVTYIYEHDDDHALGVVVNRPIGLSLNELLGHLEITSTSSSNTDSQVFSGGPVRQEQGFVIHTPIGDWDATIKMPDDIGVTISRDILVAIGAGAGPANAILALGYAGWGPGQLEQEIADNAWLSTPASGSILFATPADQRWHAAAALLGVDLRLLSSDVGHA